MKNLYFLSGIIVACHNFLSRARNTATYGRRNNLWQDNLWQDNLWQEVVNKFQMDWVVNKIIENPEFSSGYID